MQSAQTKIFILLSICYWLFIYILNPDALLYYDIFGLLLGILPAYGCINSIKIAKSWGSKKSHVGKSIIYLATTLCAWAFGQVLFLVYEIITRDIPYPGPPDIFFVLIDPLYALAMVSIMRYTGAARNIKNSATGYLMLLAIPLLAIYINYTIFFGDFAIFQDLQSPETLFDLLYTFGSTAIMALTAITLILSINKLGGKMKSAIYLIFLGIILQYIGDIFYSIAELEGQVYNGSFADFVFFLSISAVILGINSLNPKVLTRQKNENDAT